MGFRSDVRKFIIEQDAKDITTKLLLEEIANLRSQNKNLMDRLMAKNFQELKVYSGDESSPDPSVTFNYEEPTPEDDYQNAGEIV